MVDSIGGCCEDWLGREAFVGPHRVTETSVVAVPAGELGESCDGDDQFGVDKICESDHNPALTG